jgi:ribosomal protein L32
MTVVEQKKWTQMKKDERRQRVHNEMPTITNKDASTSDTKLTLNGRWHLPSSSNTEEFQLQG